MRCALSIASSRLNLDFFHFDRFHFVAAFECIDVLHAFNHFAKYSMLAVQMRLRSIAFVDVVEELLLIVVD